MGKHLKKTKLNSIGTKIILEISNIVYVKENNDYDILHVDFMLDPERDFGTVLIAGRQGHESVEPTVIETVRDEPLRRRLMDLLGGRIEQLCAMPAAAAADEIGQKDFSMVPRKAAGLYNFVVANNILTFDQELQERRRILHFTPRGLLAYVGLANEDVKGARRRELLQRVKPALGDVLGRQLHEMPHDRTRPGKSNTLLERSEMPLTEGIEAEVGRPSYLRRIPKFTLERLYLLAQLTPQQFSDWLATVPGTDFDAVTVPPDIFPAALTMMLLVAADTCVDTGRYDALKEFDPSLAEVNKQELRHGASLADDKFFKNHPERKNYAQLHRVLMLWFEKKAVRQIEWREDA